ncbi:hypothetical protein [Kaarinaea lacus]
MVEELKPEELDANTFKIPECKIMDDKDIREKTRELFSSGRIMP